MPKDLSALERAVRSILDIKRDLPLPGYGIQAAVWAERKRDRITKLSKRFEKSATDYAIARVPGYADLDYSCRLKDTVCGIISAVRHARDPISSFIQRAKSTRPADILLAQFLWTTAQRAWYRTIQEYRASRAAFRTYLDLCVAYPAFVENERERWGRPDDVINLSAYVCGLAREVPTRYGRPAEPTRETFK